jgi:amino acid permease
MARAFADGGLVVSTIATPIIGIIMSGCIHLLIRVNTHLCEKLHIEPMDYEDVRHLINIYYY